MKDVILEKFFEPDRWEYAINKGVDKHIKKGELLQLTKPETRAAMYLAIKDGKYKIIPPHTAEIPKDNGDFRTVYINEPIDRIFLSIANDLLHELMPEMTHPQCCSYQKGIGCGKVVKSVSKEIANCTENVIGWKSDLSKYFDSVPLKFIDECFDKVEKKYGQSAIITVLRDYYHCDYYFNKDGELLSNYQSLKQGCAVASWLANVLLYSIDAILSDLDGVYYRYSDDMLFVGKDYEVAMFTLKSMLASMSMTLNPKKVEYLKRDRWFKFLGYSIKGSDISLSSTRIKKFQKEIENLTIKKQDTTLKKALNKVNRHLYKGNGEFSWATQILPVCNVKKDIHELDKFVMDCLRAVITGKRKVGGLGYVANQTDGCIHRGKGRNVKANRSKTPDNIDGYLTISCMQNAMLTKREVYNTLVGTL